LIPDTELELERQDEDMESMLPDVENMGFGNDPNNQETNKPDVNAGDEEDSIEEE